MEVEDQVFQEKDQFDVEDEEWDLDEVDPNDFYQPDVTQSILDIQEIANITAEMIQQKIVNFLNSSKEGETYSRNTEIVDAVMNALANKIIHKRPLELPLENEDLEMEAISRNHDTENDYSPQDKAQMEEAERLSKLEKDSMIIHIDIKRAFDNISPKTFCSFINKMADSQEFKILKPFKNILKKWMVTSGAERIRIEGYQDFKRHYGGPQGSLWTPAIWNLYLTVVLMNSPLKRMIRLYADNVFIWIAPNNIQEEYIKKILVIAKKVLEVANLEINQDEIFAFWRGKKPKYRDIMQKVIRLEEEQRILGYWFKLSNQGEWVYKIKFWIPMNPRRSLIHVSFKDRLLAFRAKAMGGLYYQIQGWFLFGNPEDTFDWPDLDKNIRIAFANWTGLQKISYLDMASIGILLRFYLMDKLTQAYSLAYLNTRRLMKDETRRKIDVAQKEVNRLLKIKYLQEDLNGKKMVKRMALLGKNFTSQIADDPAKILHWIQVLASKLEKDKLFTDQNKKYKDFYVSKLDPVIKDWDTILNFQRKFTIERRYKDQYLINEGGQIRWRNRAFWHLCLGKQMNREDAEKYLDKIKLAIRDGLTWTQVMCIVLDIEGKPKGFNEKVKDFLNKHDWRIIDDILQILDTPLSGDKKWKTQQILYICHKYANDIDREYIDYLQMKSQMLKSKDK